MTTLTDEKIAELIKKGTSQRVMGNLHGVGRKKIQTVMKKFNLVTPLAGWRKK